MASTQVMTGRFEGYYFTRQKRPLDISEFLPSDDTHKANVYRGELFDARPDDRERPPGDPPRDALCFPELNNIQVHPVVGSPFTVSFVTGFRNVVLLDIEVVESWELNGKMYGFFKATFIGELLLKEEDRPDPLPPGTGTGIGTGIGTATSSTVSTPTKITGSGRSSSLFTGPNFRRTAQGRDDGNCLYWMGLIFLFFFLLFLINLCSSGDAGTADNTELAACEEKNKSLKRENKRLRQLNDSLSTALEKASLEAKLKKFASRIYFYGNEDRIREYSRGAIRELATFLRKNPDYRIRIEGHRNPMANLPEQLRDLDLKRAGKVKALLLENGITENRMVVVGKGGSEPIVPHDQLDLDPQGNQYNRNMRVELKIIE